MAVQGELPKKSNTRGGVGWWMDPSGVWRPPEEWPEDHPPFEGWVRNEDGRWAAPEVEHEPTLRAAEPAPIESGDGEQKKRLSRQAKADRRAMFTVAGVLVAAALLLVGVLLLITQAGATGTGAPVGEAEPEVIFAAVTDQAVLAQRRALAVEAPRVASEQLESLMVRDQAGDDAPEFDSDTWTVAVTDCLDVGERVLISRSTVQVTYADQLECVLDNGRWTDRYLDTTIDSVIDARVEPLVPAEVVNASGGDRWTPDTRESYLSDLTHPATFHVVAADSGHNPRAASPDAWRPSNQSTWCAYAVDWVAVKTRWELTVTAPEVAALSEMLATCDDLSSTGADIDSMVAEAIADPSIEFGPGS